MGGKDWDVGNTQERFQKLYHEESRSQISFSALCHGICI